MHATVSELKAHLSAFLAAVRRGDTVVVCDRKTPIARVVPLEQRGDDLEVVEAAEKVPPLKRLRAPRLRQSAASR